MIQTQEQDDLRTLLPCPFCGGEAERFTIEDESDPANFGGDVIQCKSCLASSRVEFGRKENLVSAWNKRARNDVWQPPPEDQRPGGYRCIAMVEVEWCDSLFGRCGWCRPDDQRMYRIEEGAPGTHGFLSLPASEGAA